MQSGRSDGMQLTAVVRKNNNHNHNNAETWLLKTK